MSAAGFFMLSGQIMERLGTQKAGSSFIDGSNRRLRVKMRLLKLGSTGPSVQLLQLALNRAGFGTLDTDGIFGAATKQALTRFQSAYGLAADGVAGSLTHRALLPWYTGYLVHQVRRGESFFSIAGNYGSSAEAIATANPGLGAENLQIGASIIVPLPFPVVPDNINYCSALIGYCVRGLAARYPFLSTGEIGKSVMGKPLWSLRAGRGENRVAYNSSHHANEWITTPVLLRFTEELAGAYAAGGDIFGTSAAEILDYATLCILPAVNPDGIDLVTGELTSGEYYRSAQAIAAAYPAFPFPAGWKANIRGIDLNLQYPAGWEQARENKFALGITSPAPGDFVGTAPLTAPESRAMYDFTLSFDPALILAYHTQGEVIYWRFLDYEPAGSRQIAQAFSNASGYAVEETPFASGFAGYKDWFIQDFDRPGYTIEAGRGVNPLPIEDFPEIYARNLGILTLGTIVT